MVRFDKYFTMELLECDLQYQVSAMKTSAFYQGGYRPYLRVWSQRH